MKVLYSSSPPFACSLPVSRINGRSLPDPSLIDARGRALKPIRARALHTGAFRALHGAIAITSG